MRLCQARSSRRENHEQSRPDRTNRSSDDRARPDADPVTGSAHRGQPSIHRDHVPLVLRCGGVPQRLGSTCDQRPHLLRQHDTKASQDPFSPPRRRRHQEVLPGRTLLADQPSRAVTRRHAARAAAQIHQDGRPDSSRSTRRPEGTFKSSSQRRTRSTTGSAWSPSGTRIYFTRDLKVAGYRLFVCNADGTALSRIAAGAQVFDVTVSPTGARLAFIDGRDRLGVMATNGTNQRLLVSMGGPSNRTGPPTAPRSSSRATVTSPRSLLMVRTYPSSAGLRGSSKTNPSGHRTAHRSCSSHAPRTTFHVHTDIFTIAPNGSNLKRVTDTPGKMKYFPQWGPG